MRIFIASSTERKDEAYEVGEMLADLGCEVRLWTTGGVFLPAEYTLESLIRVTREVNAALFLLMSDDRLWYRGQELSQPRDNVLFEYGLFTGALGRSRCVVLTQAGTKLATDLAGLNTIQVEPGNWLGARRQLKNWLGSIKSTPPEARGDSAEHDAISGRWRGEGRDLFVANGNPPTTFDMDAHVTVDGYDWKVQAVISVNANSAYPILPLRFELVANGRLNPYGWASLHYNNLKSPVPHHGVFYLRYNGYPEALEGYFAGFSASRRTLIAGSLFFQRVAEQV
jgi:hypothetical protein